VTPTPTSALACAAALSAFFLAGCANMPSSSQSADEAAIRLARLTQTQAIAKGDLDVVVAYWTPDVTMRRAMGQPVEGAAAGRKILEPTGPTPSPILYQRKSSSVEVSANWPLAYEEGTWSGHSEAPTPSPSSAAAMRRSG
jgi:ketosteroid isomerase-like protein